MSITLRLILGLSVLMALFWGATALVTRKVFVDEIDEIVTESMATSARHLMPLVQEVLARRAASVESGKNEATELPDFSDDMVQLSEAAEGFMAFDVRDPSGQIVLKSGDAAALDLPDASKAGFRQWHDLLAFTLVDHSNGLSLTVLEPGAHRTEAIAEATRALLWPLLYLVPLMAVAVLVLSRVSLAPVLGLSRQIALRGGSNLGPLESRGLPAELHPIGIAVDRLMDRLRAALDAERVFANYAAHEMRTPIAGALAQVQRLKAELGQTKGADRVAEIEGRLKHLVDFTEKLLQLSRAEAGLGIQGVRQNMTLVLNAVIREFSDRVVVPVSIVVQNTLGQDLMVAMDADAFAICLRNLLENAALHGARDGQVRLVVGQDWTVRVINDGPVVPPEQLSELTKRFVRGDTLSDGSGLGLAIVEKILRQSDGSLVLNSPATGQAAGFEAVMVLP